MLALVSPAKKLDFSSEWNALRSPTTPQFLKDTEELVKIAKKLSKTDIKELMTLSDKLASLNYDRYESFNIPFSKENARPAIFAFRGDTYVGLDADTLKKEDLEFAQNHLGILSGLYGLLRPMDLIHPYRLEMGTRLKTERGKNLYAFWGNLLTKLCNQVIKDHKEKKVICLASNEYIKAIDPKALKGELIICHFKELKNGEPKTIGLLAKRARGAMARFIIQNRIEALEGLKSFNSNGYQFSKTLSDNNNFLFLRKSK